MKKYSLYEKVIIFIDLSTGVSSLDLASCLIPEYYPINFLKN